jgi:hypothetical protein
MSIGSVILDRYKFITVEILVPNPSPFEAEITIAKFKKYKSPGSGQILAQLIQAGGEALCSEIHLSNPVWNKEELPDQWKAYIIVPIYKKSDKTNYSNYNGISPLSTSYKILSNIVLSWLSPYINEITEDHQRGFQLLIRYFAFVRYLIKNRSTMRQYISYP